jgi:hypothetical protein
MEVVTPLPVVVYSICLPAIDVGADTPAFAKLNEVQSTERNDRRVNERLIGWILDFYISSRIQRKRPTTYLLST